MSGSMQVFPTPETTETVWENPFGISDAVEISELSGEVGFMYATVFLTGPSKIGLAAKGRAGKIRAGAAFAVSQKPDEQVFSLELSKLNIGSVVQFIGDAYQIHELREFGKEDFLVFTDAKMYFSTGGTIARKEYPAGISASGQMTLFGKNAAFEASATTDGLKFLGTLDEFQIGPLIVTSASGAKQAKLVLEVTRDRQYFEIDGMIKFYDIQLKALVKAGLKPFELEALISIHLGDVLKFDLEARLKNIDKRDLKNADVYLRCEFDADILGKFLDAIEDFLDSIQKLTDESIDSIEIKLLQMKHEVEGKRLATQTKLITARREVQERREARNTIYTQEQKRLKAAREELQRLERLVRDAKDKEAAAVKQAEQQLLQARRKCNILKEQKRKEYAVELQRVENEKRKYESEKRDLENKKRIKFGDAIKSLEYAESRVATLADNLKMHNRRVAMFERLVRESGHFAKAFKWVELQGEIVARDAVLTAKMVAEGILRDVKNVVRGAEIMGIEKALNLYANKVNQVAGSLEALVTKGPDAFAMALVQDEEEKIRLRTVELNKLLAHNSVYGQAIRDAQRRLDENSSHLEEEIAAADNKIADARDDKRLKDLEARLASLLDEERLLNEKIRNIVQILEGIRTGVREVTTTMKGIIQGVKNVTIRITKLKVEVDAQDLRNGGKLKFEVHAMVFGRAKSVKVNWSPKQTAQELFTDVTKQMIGV